MQLPRRHTSSFPFDRQAVEQAIEALYRTHRHRRFAGELTPADLYHHRRRFARLIGRAIAEGSYRFSPAEVYRATIEGRSRVLYRSTAIDSVVERLVGRWLAPLIEAQLSPRCYSYRVGYSALRAIRELRHFIRAHRRATPAVRQRGLWLLRRDVRGYGEAIPVGPHSALWPRIDRALSSVAPPLARRGRALLQQLLARHCSDGAGAFCLAVGTPTGSPIQPLINNLYLAGVDEQLARLDGFYARFGDDMLFASPSLAVARQARDLLAQSLEALALQTNADKHRDLYLTAAARPPDAQGWIPADRVVYLGLTVAFRGGVSLSRPKWRRLLHLLRCRLRRAGRAVAHEPPSAAAAALGQIARRSLDPSDPLCLPYADLLAQIVDDRQQLGDFDELLRREVAQICSGQRGVRALRQLPPRRLRHLGLPSVSARRNRSAR